MMPTLTADKSASIPAPPPRFSWPMRIFLSFILLDMIFRSHAAITPYLSWMDDLEMSRFPKRFPTWKEISTLQENAEPDQPDPVWQRIAETVASLPEYFNPSPSEKVRDKLEDSADWAKYAFCWVASRLHLFESLTGFDQRWTMFSPTLARSVTLPRLRLHFKDGTTLDLRLLSDPHDLTCFFHGSQVKLRGCEAHVISDYDARLGYCNFVGCRYPDNGHGSALEKVYIYKIRYVFPALDENAFETLQAQNGPPDWDESGPSWVYDPVTRELSLLSKEERTAMQEHLAIAHSLGETTPDYQGITKSH